MKKKEMSKEERRGGKERKKKGGETGHINKNTKTQTQKDVFLSS